MTPEQEEHLKQILNFITLRLEEKYRAGQREHGGDLWTKPCLPHAIEEVTDLVVYTQTMLRQVTEAHDLLQDAIAGKDWTKAATACAMLTGQLRPSVG